MFFLSKFQDPENNLIGSLKGTLISRLGLSVRGWKQHVMHVQELLLLRNGKYRKFYDMFLLPIYCAKLSILSQSPFPVGIASKNLSSWMRLDGRF